MKVWSELKYGTDGRLYGIRYLLTVEEVKGLQASGLIGDVRQVVGMQAVADMAMADFERQAHVVNGGALQ